MRRGLTRGPIPARRQTHEVYVRCPGCGGYYEPDQLRLRAGNTRGLAVCGVCYHRDGPDGQLQRAR